MRDEKETSLVIEHETGVFHLTTNRVSLGKHLRELAQVNNLDCFDSDGHLTLSNVPVKLLSKLNLASHSQRRSLE